jgi:hypothetical protein
MFGGCCALGLLIVKFITPETKGIPLEELELNLKSGMRLSAIGKRTHG